MSAVTYFIKDEMGVKYIQPPIFDIRKSYNDSNSLLPLVFILSPGSDPISALTKFSESMGFGSKLHALSLGQGQVRQLYDTIYQVLSKIVSSLLSLITMLNVV